VKETKIKGQLQAQNARWITTNQEDSIRKL
jgi:hypothetical protein